MDIAKLNEWMQVVGIFAVVLSLIFVGLQLKQSQEIAIADQYQGRYSVMIEVLSARQLDPDHARYIGEREIARDGYPPGFDQNISDREYGRRFLDVRMSLMALDNYHLQYQSGFLEEEAWAASVRMYSNLFGSPVGRHYIDNYKESYRPAFQEVIEQYVKEVGH